MPEFHYDPEQHRYTLDGIELPSVTHILAPLNNFDGIPPKILENARERGQAVHRAIELDCENNLDESTLHEDIIPYFEAWRKFFVEWEPEIIGIEQQVYHPTLRYAGTLDLKLRARGSLYYVDTKNTYKIPASVALQTKAYQEADAAMNGHSVEGKCAVLWLEKDGTYKFVEQDNSDWPVFLQLLTQIHTSKKTQKVVELWKSNHK